MRLLEELAETIRGRAQIRRTPAVLCGDRLSNAVAVAAHATGREFQPYAMATNGNEGRELQEIADHLGWRLKLVLPPIDQLSADFFHLAVQHRCFTSHQIALGYTTMQVCEAVDETDVWLSIPRWNMEWHAWPAATRIAARYEKSLFNPCIGMTLTHVSDDRLWLMVHEAKSLAGKI